MARIAMGTVKPMNNLTFLSMLTVGAITVVAICWISNCHSRILRRMTLEHELQMAREKTLQAALGMSESAEIPRKRPWDGSPPPPPPRPPSR